jgi:hypothetical protein
MLADCRRRSRAAKIAVKEHARTSGSRPRVGFLVSAQVRDA